MKKLKQFATAATAWLKEQKLVVAFLETWKSATPYNKGIIAFSTLFVILLFSFLLVFAVKKLLPFVLMAGFVLYCIYDTAKQKSTKSKAQQQAEIDESTELILGFAQWFCSRSNRERYGINAVPLASSLAHLRRNLTVSTDKGFPIFSLSLQLEAFDSSMTYLCYFSLVDPLAEAITEFCASKGIPQIQGSNRIQVVSATLADGAILTELALTFYDLKNSATLHHYCAQPYEHKGVSKQ